MKFFVDVQKIDRDVKAGTYAEKAEQYKKAAAEYEACEGEKIVAAQQLADAERDLVRDYVSLEEEALKQLISWEDVVPMELSSSPLDQILGSCNAVFLQDEGGRVAAEIIY